MKKYKWPIILANLLILLIYFNTSIFNKEKMLDEGKLLLLELAPVDPRSLMQGDYMSLNYAISTGVAVDSISKRGYCVVKLDSLGVAQRLRIQPEKTPLNDDEWLIAYHNSAWNMNIGAESYFFQEGTADKYAEAKYGGIKVDGQGNSLLIGLYGENLKPIE
ncbi:MAG: GDYXXLXY domain-containing protein [Saprospiraceae bacterium]|nr:GDYXXLXY domain-containing protein [Saprospiraceae bacterium]MBP7644002.1 GDYXXLXY domain-containing protein [Saprospiraceae bacterium]